ncbi:MAG: lysophospholipid acyltransferase family protein [Thermoanaerobaculia bacterium]|nr:hypothetical protein [Thermoanaerobaculia bacterium]MCK6686063.1 lysophospholipid acyltransferase family protein [Thermoanaerobaculia bacterium]
MKEKDGPEAPAPDTPAGRPARISAGYRAVRALARFLLHLFYKRIDTVGLENLPAAGGVVVAANHHNSVIDALLLIAVLPRQLRTLANAPLFRHPLIGPFLRLLGALPVHRKIEAGNDPSRNASLFAATTGTLQGGGAIMIFPEGRTQPEPVLQELRTGAARMVLAASAGGTTPVTLLPVGLLYHAPGTFREGRALVRIGPPVVASDCLNLSRTEPEHAARLLTAKLTTALKGLIVEAEDRQTLRLLVLVEELWRAEGGNVPVADAERVIWLQRAMRTYRLLAERFPDRVAAFRQELDSLAADVERAQLDPARLARSASPSRLAGRAAWEAFLLLLGAPAALVGIAVHALPYHLTGFVDARLERTDEEVATDKLAIGIVFFPLFWAVELWAAYALGGVWAALAFLLALLPSGFFALAWQERLRLFLAETRALVLCLGDRELPQRIATRRRELAAQLAAMAREVPEEWPG